MASGLIEPEYRSLTVPKLYKNDVIELETLAVLLECSVDELVTVLIQYAVKQGNQMYPSIVTLRRQKKKDEEQRAVVREKLAQLQERIDGQDKL